MRSPPSWRRHAINLSRAGIPLGNQSVLLAGVNDCVHIQRNLVQNLVRMRVRPYYLYQCDLVEGAGHFRTPVAKGIEIIEGLRGHTSGFAVPTFCVDAPGGGGKIPVMPNYHISSSDHKIILRNFEGYISTYEEPVDYKPHDPKTCAYCQNKRLEPGQRGISGLLDGDAMTIKPEGFDQIHRGVEPPTGCAKARINGNPLVLEVERRKSDDVQQVSTCCLMWRYHALQTFGKIRIESQ